VLSLKTSGPTILPTKVSAEVAGAGCNKTATPAVTLSDGVQNRFRDASEQFQRRLGDDAELEYDAPLVQPRTISPGGGDLAPSNRSAQELLPLGDV